MYVKITQSALKFIRTAAVTQAPDALYQRRSLNFICLGTSASVLA